METVMSRIGRMLGMRMHNSNRPVCPVAALAGFEDRAPSRMVVAFGLLEKSNKDGDFGLVFDFDVCTHVSRCLMILFRSLIVALRMFSKTTWVLIVETCFQSGLLSMCLAVSKLSTRTSPLNAWT